MTPPNEGCVAGGWTRGPLAVHPFKAWIVCEQLDDDGEPCPVAALAWPTTYRSEAETFANGRLFAAAPDLYEALVGMLAMHGSDIEEQAARDKARAALARANGEKG